MQWLKLQMKKKLAGTIAAVIFHRLFWQTGLLALLVVFRGEMGILTNVFNLISCRNHTRYLLILYKTPESAWAQDRIGNINPGSVSDNLKWLNAFCASLSSCNIDKLSPVSDVWVVLFLWVINNAQTTWNNLVYTFCFY